MLFLGFRFAVLRIWYSTSVVRLFFGHHSTNFTCYHCYLKGVLEQLQVDVMLLVDVKPRLLALFRRYWMALKTEFRYEVLAGHFTNWRFWGTRLGIRGDCRHGIRHTDLYFRWWAVFIYLMRSKCDRQVHIACLPVTSWLYSSGEGASYMRP